LIFPHLRRRQVDQRAVDGARHNGRGIDVI
jgi:hypothetical protein